MKGYKSYVKIVVGVVLSVAMAVTLFTDEVTFFGPALYVRAAGETYPSKDDLNTDAKAKALYQAPVDGRTYLGKAYYYSDEMIKPNMTWEDIEKQNAGEIVTQENLRKIYAMPWIVPGSDASLRAPWGPLGADHPHPRAYGTMPEFYRRVAGLEGRERTIARMTSIPAARFGIANRGVLAKGAFADVAVWREDRFRNTATYARSHSFCTGVEKVFVNGALAYDAGKFTHAGTGRFLERGG